MEQSTQSMDEYISIYDKPKRGKGKPSGDKKPMKKKNEQDYQQWNIIIAILKTTGKTKDE